MKVNTDLKPRQRINRYMNRLSYALIGVTVLTAIAIIALSDYDVF